MRVWQRIEAAVDRFIPADIRAAPEPARRARLAIALAWFTVVLSLLAAVVQGRNNAALLAMHLASAGLCIAAPFAIRRFGRPTLWCNIVLGVSFVKYAVVVAFMRGPGLNGATVMLGQLPLIATFLMGVRIGLVWLSASLVTGFAIAGLGRAGVIADHMPAENRLVNDHFILALTTLILFMVAWLYERMKDGAQRQIYTLEAARQAAEVERVQALARSQLAEAQRLASLGRIAASTAHEINSPLSAVIANLQLAGEVLPSNASPHLAESIREALASARRIGTIVADMNQHSRPRVESGTIAVGEAIATAVKLAQPHVQARARVALRLADGLPRAVADASVVDAVLELLVNAAEAMPEGRAAANEIVIAARHADESVTIDVTQATGPAAQLGIELCRAIVEKLGGTLAVVAEDAVVRIMLAAAKPAPAPVVVERQAPKKLDILVVDDDEAILTTLKRVLSANAITIARGGREALTLFDANEFDLILCDLMMPDLTGMDFYEQLSSKHPDQLARIVFMTGGTFTSRADEFRRTVTNHFIEKPFNLSELRRVVADCVPRERRSTAA